MVKHKVGLEDGTSLVATAKHFVDHTGVDVGVGRTIDIGVGTLGEIAVTAAKDLVEASAVDDDLGVGMFCSSTHVSRIAAAIGIPDGVVARIDVNRGHGITERPIHLVRCIVGQVTAAEHRVDGIILRQGIDSQRLRGGDVLRCCHSQDIRNIIVVVANMPMCRLIHVDVDIAQRRAGEIVGTIHVAEDGDFTKVVRSFTLGVVLTDVQGGVTLSSPRVEAHEGHGTAAEGIALERTAHQIHLGVAIHTACHVTGFPRHRRIHAITIISGVVLVG